MLTTYGRLNTGDHFRMRSSIGDGPYWLCQCVWQRGPGSASNNISISRDRECDSPMHHSPLLMPEDVVEVIDGLAVALEERFS